MNKRRNGQKRNTVHHAGLLFAYCSQSGAEQFSFYRVPKALFTMPVFDGLHTEVKLLYGMMLDRTALSRRNGWMDVQGRVYIYFTLEDVMENLKCAMQKAAMLIAQLEGFGLIEKKKQGSGRPTAIYVKLFSAQPEDEEQKDTGICIPRSPETKLQEVWE